MLTRGTRRQAQLQPLHLTILAGRDTTSYGAQVYFARL